MAINTIYSNIVSEKGNSFLTKNRLTYIDVAKGIGISMIVWGHAHCFGANYFISFAVPLFVLISGFLYNTELSLKEYTKRKFLTLYLPFVLCNLLWPTFVLYAKANAGYPITNNLIYLFLIILTLKKDGVFFGATWFLSTLFFACMSYKLIDISLQKLKYKNYVILAFYSFLAYAACQLMPYLNTDIRRTLVLTLFFAIGAFIKSNISLIRKMDTKFALITACPVFILFEVYLTKAGLVGYSYMPNTLYHLIMFIISSLLSAYIIISLSRIVANNHNGKICKLFSYLGQNSLHILLWQFVFFEMLTAFFLRANNIPLYYIDRFPHAVKTSGIWGFVYFLIGILGPVILVNTFRMSKKFFMKLSPLIVSRPNA